MIHCVKFAHGKSDVQRIINRSDVVKNTNTHGLLIRQQDLKPENILLDSEGHIRLADFGLAKLLSGETIQTRRTASICGTREYFAPEMLCGDYGRSVDLWSLGIFMYHILIGTTPFESDDAEEVRRGERGSHKTLGTLRRAQVLVSKEVRFYCAKFLLCGHNRSWRRSSMRRSRFQHGFQRLREVSWRAC